MPLGKRTDCGNAKYAGIWPSSMANVVDGIQEALYQVGFDFIAVSLNHKDLGTGIGDRQKDVPRTCIRSDLDLTSQAWTSQVIGVASEPKELGSNTASAEDLNARRSVVSHLLCKELGWASYLGLQAVILPPVDRISIEGAAVVAQVVNKVLMSKTYMQVWVQIPLEISMDQHASHFEKWHIIRALCNHHAQVRVALLLGEDLPDKDVLSVWDGEPVRTAIIPVSIFKFNSKGYPILTQRHQEFLSRLFRFGVQFILKDDSLNYKLGNNVMKTAQDAEGGPLKVYWEYLSFLFRRLEPLTEVEAAEYEYRDYLQSPLQPLQDHLESATYEVFERDKMKYTTYEEAVYKALLDKFPSSETSQLPTLMVVGAGRGPLVLASLRASKRAKIPVKVFAVEKNPNAYVTLLHLHQKEKWGESVTIVHKDMRHWVTEEKADIMVSELLGSFGDNELSPECLDGAQRFLAEDGISIPYSYTSYLAPITSSKLHEEVKNLKKLKHLETPYVVKLFAHTVLAKNQEVFYFSHPNREMQMGEEGEGGLANQIDNERFKMLTFRRPETSPPAVLHGFAGYFESVLYKDVLLSIRPETHTPNMFSWFPIFFPLVKPVYLERGEREIQVSMWRRCESHKVWYEYALTSPEIQNLVNPEGRSYAAEL